jgi:hypothetical protein
MVGLAIAFICRAEEVPDSVDTFNNQTVATEITVQGRTVLTSQNVTVTNTGQLTLNGPQGIYIPQSFEVNRGGSLTLNGGLQFAVTFTYDASGNRIRREKEY